MKRVLFLTSINPADKSPTEGLSDLAAKLRKRLSGASFTFGALGNLEIRLIRGKSPSVRLEPGGIDIKDFDLVIFRLWHRAPEQAVAVAKYLRYLGIRYIDNDIPKEGLSKFASVMTMFLNDISVPSTILANRHRLLRVIDEPKLPISFPLVLKDTFGSKSRNNFLVTDSAKAKRIITDYPEVEFIAQQYITSPIHYRLLVLGGKTRLIIKHNLQPLAYGQQSSLDDDKTAMVDIKEFSPQALKDAEKVCRIKGIDVAGVDVILDNNGLPYILDVNPAPQLDTRHFSKEKTDCYLSYIKSLISG